MTTRESQLNVEHLQSALREARLDGWLFYDFRGSDPLASSILGLTGEPLRSRRWFYFVPSTGEPIGVVHAIEPAALDALPGRKLVYARWQTLHETLRTALTGAKRVAMQYSPFNNIPYVSRVDAGTIELVRSLGVDVVSSADLVTEFEATVSSAQLESHHIAAAHVGRLVLSAFDEIGRRLSAGQATTEYDIQQFLWQGFEQAGLTADHRPNVSVGPHSADPHYEPNRNSAASISRNQFVLIDAWCKQEEPGAIYADITWVGFTGQSIPPEIAHIFEIVKSARDAAFVYVRDKLAQGHAIRGCDVDDVCRAVIDGAGFGEYFTHRTGHSLHEQTHGNGANLDNLESRDERRLIPRTLFTIEPGIYLRDRFGVRSEVNVYVQDERKALLTGIPPQQEIVAIFR